MPPVLGLVAVARALVVARRREQRHVVAVGQGEDVGLGAVEVALDHDDGVVAAGGELLGEQRLHRGVGGRPVRTDRDALAAGKPVRLHDVRRGEAVQGRGGLVQVAPRPPVGRRDACRDHDVLGVGLGALDARGVTRRAEHCHPGGRQRVGDASDQRRLRADDDEVDALAQRELAHLRGVARVEVDQLRDGADAGVARRAQHLGPTPSAPAPSTARARDRRRRGRLAREPSRGAPGHARASVWERAGPTDTQRIGTPASSSSRSTYACASLGRSA